MLSPNTQKDLFALAFRFRKAHIWSILTEGQLFALQLMDGSVGYCHIAGHSGPPASLSIYPGKPGFTSLYNMMRAGAPASDNDMFLRQYTLDQKCVRCMFSNESDATADQVREVLRYSRLLRVRVARSECFPHFEKVVPMHCPAPINEEMDASLLMQALRAGLALAVRFQKRKLSPLILPPIRTPTDLVPYLVLSDASIGGYDVKTIRLPGLVETVLPPLPAISADTIKLLNACAPSGVWDCGIAFKQLHALENGLDCIPSVPVVLSSEGILPLQGEGILEKQQDKMQREFLDSMIRLGKKPEVIRLHPSDLHAQNFFRQMANLLDVPVVLQESLPELNQAIRTVTREDELNGPDAITRRLCKLFLDLDMDSLRHAPPKLQETGRNLFRTEHPAVTKEVQDKIRASLPFWD